MQILIADDESVSRVILETTLQSLGHDVIVCDNGKDALYKLTSPHAPRLAVLDWMMPGYSGIEICKLIRQEQSQAETYIILLTGRDQPSDIAKGLEAGANDYMTKPFHLEELRARINNGQRLVEAWEQLRVFSGLLAICAWCKRIHTADDQWEKLEAYIEKNSHARFSHGGCPDCAKKLR